MISRKLHFQVGADGKEFKLKDPFADELPARGFDPGEDTYQVSVNTCAIICMFACRYVYVCMCLCGM